MAMALPFLGPALGIGLGVGGGLMQMNAQRQAQRRMSQMQDQQMAALGQARQAATGPLSAAQQDLLNRQREQLRGAQASRGIFESGVAAGQEGELMPQIENQFRQQQMNAMLGLAQGWGSPIASQGGMMGGGMGGPGQLVGQGIGMLPGAFGQMGFGQPNPYQMGGMGMTGGWGG